MDDKEKMMAKILKSRRNELMLNIDDVVAALEERGIHVNAKTLYGYENAVSRPSVLTFLALCRIYGIDNPVEYFEDNL